MQASLPGSAVDAALTVEISPVVATTETPQPKAASYAELKAACVGADPAFLCSQLEANTTVDAATAAWMAAQNERIEASRQRPGVDAVGTKPSKARPTGDALQDWKDALAEKMETGMKKGAAVSALAKESPELHKAYLDAVNSR